MVKKYSVPWCFTNHAGHEKDHFFQFPEDEQQMKTLLRFLNRSDAQEFKQVLVCAKHFSDNVINKNEKRFWFIKKLKHVPLIASSSQMFLIGFLRQSSAKTSKGKNISGRSSGRTQEIEYHHKFGWYQWKANEVFGWRFFSRKKNIYRSYHTAFPYWRTFFVDWSPHVEIYCKGIMMSLPT